MTAIETAIAGGRQKTSHRYERPLARRATRSGRPGRCATGWRLAEAGVSTPILVPSSATGNQLKAVEEIFAAFA